MKPTLIAIGACLAVTSPALAAREVLTPSGKPDVIFAGSDLATAASKIASKCMDAGWQVTEQTPNQVTCEIPVGVLASALQQLALGNSYSTTPRTFVRVSLAQIGPHTRAQAMEWTETQMAFGQVRQMQYTDDKQIDGMQRFLLSAGGDLPPGTTFPGNFLGVDGQPELAGKVVTVPITKVFPGTPAQAAGLLVGDRILKVNGQSFKDLKGYRSAISKIGIGVRYPLLIARNGTEQTVVVEARQRPAAGTPEFAAIQAAAVIPAASAPPAPPALVKPSPAGPQQ